MTRLSTRMLLLNFLFLSTVWVHTGCSSGDSQAGTAKKQETEAPQQPAAVNVAVEHRAIAIDNVCAWPNLTVLNDGTIIATIFNQPSHAKREGDVECWASSDGRFWEKRGTATAHDPRTNRMNVAAGLAKNGDLVVVASGWSLKPAETPDGWALDEILRAWVSRSSDGGRTWKVNKDAFPKAESGMTNFIPFGDILPGNDGSLRVLAYAASADKSINKVSMFRSDDDGRNWKIMSVISDEKTVPNITTGHNETAFFHLGGGKWIAAGRRWQAGQAMDLFRSDDDGASWRYDSQITKDTQHPAHFTRLTNGNLLLSYGNRIAGEFGVAAKISSDEGATWQDQLTITADSKSYDCGYPASVQLPNGKVLTAYYSVGVPAHQRYHMGTAIWNLP